MILTNWTGVNCRTLSGSVAVYVGTECCRFLMPTQFLNLLMFVALLSQAEEEFGCPTTGALTMPMVESETPLGRERSSLRSKSFFRGIYNMSHGIRKKE
ncbi:SAUR-like auxin-responsive protein family [Perilla frutescens var. frutescens]|nr:SAUR-like auxin-responsive protein family [Perilla frutescens var. frutescens]